MEVIIGSKSIKLGKHFAEGGEARIYKVDDKTAAKVYKLPLDSELADDDLAISAARIRLVVAQKKLPLLPRDLPDSIAAPIALIRDKASGFIIGYTMPMIKTKTSLADLRANISDITDRQILNLFLQIRDAILSVHGRGVVLGDFNDKNVLIDNKDIPHIIDIDSAQFAPFRTKVFTAEFVDPILCERSQGMDVLELVKPHTQESDWYAWWVMLFQAIFGIHPYGGVYKPKDKAKKIPSGLRGLPGYRISVYDDEVIRPKNLRPLDSVPKALDKFFQMVFRDGLRPTPPDSLFAGIQFTDDGAFDLASSTWQFKQTVIQNDQRLVPKKVFESDKVIGFDCHKKRFSFLHLRGRSLCLNDAVLSRLKSTDNVAFYLAGAQAIISNGEQAIAMSNDWDTKVFFDIKPGRMVNQAMIVGTTNGVVYYDGAFKMLVGVKRPMVRVLDIDPDIEPVGFWSDRDILTVLFVQKGRLGCLAHHILWDRTIFQVLYSYVSPQEVVGATGYSTAERTWILIKAKGDRILCGVFDPRGALVNHVETSVGSTSWMAEFGDKGVVGQYLFSPAENCVERISMLNGDVNVKTFSLKGEIGNCRLEMVDGNLFAISDDSVSELILA